MNFFTIAFPTLLLFAASLKTKLWVNSCAIVMLATYMISTTDFSFGLTFPIVNISLICILGFVLSRFKKGNFALSTLSFLFYSVLIDVISYSFFPQFRFFNGILLTIYQGIIFNLPKIILCLCVGVIYHTCKLMAELAKQNKLLNKKA